LVAIWTRTRVIGGCDSTREGDKGDKSFYYIFLDMLVLIEKSGYMCFLGKIHVVLDFM
jgi:hypothetical protein